MTNEAMVERLRSLCAAVVVTTSLAMASITACGSFSSTQPESTSADDAAAPNDPAATDGGAGATDGGAEVSTESGAPVGIDGGRLAWVFNGTFDSDEVNTPTMRADVRCTTELGRDAFAWLTSENMAPLARNPAAQGPWVDSAGVLVAETAAELTSGALRHGIYRRLDGTTASGSVWTGVTKTGVAGPDCNGWNSQAAQGIVGTIGEAKSAWTEAETALCGGNNAFLCFEK